MVAIIAIIPPSYSMQVANSSGRSHKWQRIKQSPKLINFHKDAMSYQLTNLTELLRDKITKLNKNKRTPDSWMH